MYVADFHKRLVMMHTYYSKLRFITWTGIESLFTDGIQYCLRIVNKYAQVLRLAVCRVYPWGQPHTACLKCVHQRTS